MPPYTIGRSDHCPSVAFRNETLLIFSLPVKSIFPRLEKSASTRFSSVRAELSFRYINSKFVSPLKERDSMLDTWLLPKSSTHSLTNPLKSPDSTLDSWLSFRSRDDRFVNVLKSSASMLDIWLPLRCSPARFVIR